MCLLAAFAIRDSPPAAPSPPSLVARPEMSREAGRWIIRLRAEGDLLSLQQARTAASPVVTLPVSVRPGRWLAAVLRPDNVLEVRLEDTDLSALMPGMNALTVQSPGYRLQQVRFDAAPLFRADADFRAYALAQLHTIGAADSNTSSLITSESAPGLTFARLPPSASPTADKGVRIIPLEGKAQRIYVLVSTAATVDSRDTGRIAVRCVDGTIISRPLRMAEDIVWRANPLRETVAQIDLGEQRPVEALEVEGEASVVAVTLVGGLRPGAFASLPPRARSFASERSAVLFAFDRPSLEGWEIQGSGWGMTDTVGEVFMRKGSSRYFADSKVVGGEAATGTILSPPFTVAGSKLAWLANGHSTKNFFALVDARTGDELRRSPVPEKTGPFVKVTWDVRDLKGRRVRFKAVDADTRTAYAWLAFDEISLEP